MTTWDRIVIVFALILLPWLYWLFWQPRYSGETARVKYDQQLMQEISLAKPQTVRVKGELGDSVFEIKDQQVRFTHSPCQNKVCIHYGWLTHSGEVMACIPNHIVVEIVGGKRVYDAVSF